MAESNGQRLAWILLCVWLVAYVGSFIVFQMVEPTGDGFTRGLNRITTFIGWQAVAGLLAIVLWPLGKRFPPESAGRWLVRVPLILAALLLLLVVGVIAYAGFSGS